MSGKSGHKAVKIHPGLAIYRIDSSPYFYARIWQPKQRKYLVRTTKEKSQIRAIEIARELFSDMATKGELNAVDKKRTFAYFAERMIHRDISKARAGDANLKSAMNRETYLFSPRVGLSTFIDHKDVAELTCPR